MKQTKSAQIRQLAAEGLSVSAIARQLGIRYQHAYNVLKKQKEASTEKAGRVRRTSKQDKPKLSKERLLDAGFSTAAEWVRSEEGAISLSADISSEAGLYAFCVDGEATYVGLATMGLAKRHYFYGRPGKTQRTSIRVNGLITDLLSSGQRVGLLVCTPEQLEWNGLPLNAAAGLELGLIQSFDLAWNIRGAS